MKSILVFTCNTFHVFARTEVQVYTSWIFVSFDFINYFYFHIENDISTVIIFHLKYAVMNNFLFLVTNSKHPRLISSLSQCCYQCQIDFNFTQRLAGKSLVINQKFHHQFFEMCVRSVCILAYWQYWRICKWESVNQFHFCGLFSLDWGKLTKYFNLICWRGFNWESSS